MATTAALPCVLLVEDDPVSRAFLAAAVEAMPARVEVADTLAAASALASARRHDAWLIDANLPDGRGETLLARVRRLWPGVPAIAHTADNDPGSAATLRAAGFDDVLVKPLPASTLLCTLRALLAEAAAAPARPARLVQDDWDDELAVSALNGSREHVATLRALFLDELPSVQRRVASAVRDGDAEALRAELHRLRASCGFVGAVRLRHAVERLAAGPDAASLQEWDAAACALTGEPAQAAVAAAAEAPIAVG